MSQQERALSPSEAKWSYLSEDEDNDDLFFSDDMSQSAEEDNDDPSNDESQQQGQAISDESRGGMEPDLNEELTRSKAVINFVAQNTFVLFCAVMCSAFVTIIGGKISD